MTESLTTASDPILTRHADNNIGAVRYLLALAVLVAHFNLIGGYDLPFPVSSYQGVCGFFTLSGFLIFKSYSHTPGWRYLYRRGARILPSYLTVVLLATLALATVSTLTVSEYFSSGQTWRYLLANMAFLNWIQPSLPGVFTDGVTEAVNASLWTMKIEWALYLTVPLTAWLIIDRGYRAWIVIGVTYVLSVAYRWTFWALYADTGDSLYEVLSRQFFGQMTYFYIGALAYCYFSRIRRWLPMIGIAGLIVMSAAYMGANVSRLYRFGVNPLALAAIVLSLCFAGHWGRLASRIEDCSYEIYLFHFPVVQLLSHSSAATLPAPVLLAVAVTATWAVSYCCARWISAPVRRRLMSAVRNASPR